MFTFLSNWFSAQSTMKSLASLSERELSDIGISRSMIREVSMSAANAVRKDSRNA